MHNKVLTGIRAVNPEWVRGGIVNHDDTIGPLAMD